MHRNLATKCRKNSRPNFLLTLKTPDLEPVLAILGTKKKYFFFQIIWLSHFLVFMAICSHAKKSRKPTEQFRIKKRKYGGINRTYFMEPLWYGIVQGTKSGSKAVSILNYMFTLEFIFEVKYCQFDCPSFLELLSFLVLLSNLTSFLEDRNENNEPLFI